MTPKTKKRKGVKGRDEELLINERLAEIFFKYRQDDSDDDEDSGDAMFEDENPKIKLKDVEKVVNEVGLVEWDEAVLALIDENEKKIGKLDMEKIKIMIMTLIVKRYIISTIIYVF